MEKFNFKFIPNCIVQTQRVQAKAEQGVFTTQEITDCLQKHFANEGEECKSDNKLNEDAIKRMDGRVLSSFTVRNTKLWIITDGLHLAYTNSEHTEYPLCTILLPEEY